MSKERETGFNWKEESKHETTTTYGSIEHEEFTFLKSSILSLKWHGLR